MIALILLNFPVILLAHELTRRFFYYLEAGDRVIASALLYFSYIVITQQVLGMFGVLRIENLYLINALAMLVLLFIPGVKVIGPQQISGNLAQAVKGFSENKFIIFFICGVIAFTLVKIVINLANAPFGWDSLNYHFTFAVEWLKSANLDVPIVIGDNPCPSYFPINGSLIYLWFIFPFKSVFLADLGQLPFFAMAALSIYKLSRKMCVSQEYSFFAALLMTVTPNYFKQMNIAYVDIMVCAWFLISLNFLINLHRKSSFKNALLFGLSVGLLAGTKTIALNFSLILILFSIYVLFKNKSESGFVMPLFIFVIAAVVLGGFSYIRNYLLTGNPLYPLEFQVFGKVIFKGVMEKGNFTVFASPEEYSIGNILFGEGMGAGTILFIIPGLIMLIYLTFKERKIRLYEVMLLASFIFMFLAYRYLVALPNVRYIYPMFALGYILAFYVLSRVNFPKKAVRWMVLVCVFTAFHEMARRLELGVSMGLTFILFLLILPGYKYLKNNFSRFATIVILIALFVLGVAAGRYSKNEFKSYCQMTKYTGFWPDATKAWDWLNANTVGNNIAYAGRPVPFPLYGEHFKNNVFYVSVNNTDPVKLYYFPQSFYRWGKDFTSVHKSFEDKGNYRADGSYSVWLDNILRREADYLFVYSLHQTKMIEFPMEDAWARAHPDKFSLVFSNQTIRIYKVLR
jgi:hypothetical protein